MILVFSWICGNIRSRIPSTLRKVLPTMSGFNLNDSFTDSNLEKAGVWVDFFDGSRLKIASKESPEYKAYLARLAQQHKLKIGSKKIKPETMSLMKTVMSDAMAKCLLVDWDNISLNGEENVPYSHEVGKMACLNSHILFDFVDAASEDNARFQIEQEEEVKKS